MRLSINLRDKEVGFLDAYARSRGIKSRSGVVRAALRLLHRREAVDQDYVAAFAEWSGDEDSKAWDRMAGDGLKNSDIPIPSEIGSKGIRAQTGVEGPSRTSPGGSH